MFDKSMKDEIKPLTLGFLKEIVKQFGDLVPDDTPVLMDGKSNHYNPRVKILRSVEQTRKGNKHVISAHVLHFGEEGDGTIIIDGIEYLKPKLSKEIYFVSFEEFKDEEVSENGQ